MGNGLDHCCRDVAEFDVPGVGGDCQDLHGYLLAAAVLSHDGAGGEVDGGSGFQGSDEVGFRLGQLRQVLGWFRFKLRSGASFFGRAVDPFQGRGLCVVGEQESALI